MAWPDDGNFAAWPKRKKITVSSASVNGSGTLTDFTLHVKNLAGDANIAASAHPTGKDIAFAASDGETQLGHELIPKGQWASRNAAYIWFSEHPGLMSSAGDRSWHGVVTGNGEASIVEAIHSTGINTAYTFTSGIQADDHNQPSIIERSVDGKLMASYSFHSGTDNQIRYATSTNARDASAWGTEQTMAPNGASNYSYSGLVELEAASEIWSIYRADNSSWNYTATDNTTTSFSGNQIIWNSGVTNSYMKYFKTSTSRIDFVCSEGNATSQSNNRLYHFYAEYSGGSWGWYETDGTSLGAIPTGGFSQSDLTPVVNPTGTENAWQLDISSNGSGNPIFLYAFYPNQSDPTDQELWVAEWSGSAWELTKIIDAFGGSPIPSAESHYTGDACFISGDTTKLYAGVQVSGTYEIQLWENDSGWSKLHDITTGSTGHQFRPRRVDGATESDKCHVMWMSGTYTDFTDYDTGIRLYPATGSYFDAANVKTTLDGSADNEIYIYYGRTDNVAPQWNSANAFSAATKIVIRLNEPLDVAEPYRAPNRVGGGTLTFLGEDLEDSVQINSSNGEETYNFLTTSDQIRLTSHPNLAGATALTVSAWANSTVKAGSAEYTLATNFLSTTAANYFFRLEPASSGSLEFYVIKEANTLFPTSGGAALSWSANNWYRWVGVWDTAAGSVGRRDKTEAVINATTGGALDATASEPLRLGEAPNGGDDFTGYLGEVRVVTAALSKDWTDTEYDAWTTGIVSYGSEETSGGGGGGGVVTLSKINLMGHPGQMLR